MNFLFIGGRQAGLGRRGKQGGGQVGHRGPRPGAQVFPAGRVVGGGDAVPDRGRVGARVAGQRGCGHGEEQGRQDLRLVQGQLSKGE